MDCLKAASFIRMMTGDPKKVNISDDMIVHAINGAANTLYDALAKHFSSIVYSKKTVSINNGSGSLPSDFRTLVRVEDENGDEIFRGDEWDLEDDTILSDRDSLTLIYNQGPDEIETLSDTLAIPEMFFYDIVNIASSILKANLEAAHTIAGYAAVRTGQRRAYARIPDRQIWQ